MTRYDLIIFDWDGTLADSAALIVGTMQQAIAELNLPARSDRQIRELIGLGLNDALQTLYPEFELQELLGLLSRYRARFAQTSLEEAPLFPGAVDALRALRADGFRLSVATGKSRRGLDRSLSEHATLRQMLSSSRTADETLSKPNPLMLKELLIEEDVPAERALMVGDTDYDIIMARRAGVPCVAVECGVHERARLVEAGPDDIIRDVTGLREWLSKAHR